MIGTDKIVLHGCTIGGTFASSGSSRPRSFCRRRWDHLAQEGTQKAAAETQVDTDASRA